MFRNTMTGLIAVLLMLSFTTVRAAEDDAKKSDKKRGGGLTALLAKLDLSDDQKAKIEQVNKDTEAAIKEAREKGDRDAGRAAYKARMDGIMAVLTDTQKEKLKALMAEARGGEKGKDRKKPEGEK